MSFQTETDTTPTCVASEAARLEESTTCTESEHTVSPEVSRSRVRRSQYWINYELQFRHLMMTVLIGVCASAALGVLLYTTFWLVAAENLTWETGSLAPLEAYARVKMAFLSSTVTVGLLISLVAAVGSVRVTHRVAGPIFNMQRNVNTWLNGNLGARVHLRKGDDLRDFADSLNLLADKLQQETGSRDEAIRDAISELQKHPEAWADQLAAHLESSLPQAS